MSDTHMHDDFYRCGDCAETYDAKGTPHLCEGSREEILAALASAREENARLAGVLRAICIRFDDPNNDGAESLGQELREQVDDVLSDAGINAPKMATWRLADADGPPEPVMVVGRGVAGVVRP